MCLVHRDQERAFDPLHLELWVVVTTMWVLRIEPKSSARAAGALTTTQWLAIPLWAYLPSPPLFFNPVFVHYLVTETRKVTNTKAKRWKEPKFPWLS